MIKWTLLQRSKFNIQKPVMLIHHIDSRAEITWADTEKFLTKSKELLKKLVGGHWVANQSVLSSKSSDGTAPDIPHLLTSDTSHGCINSKKYHKTRHVHCGTEDRQAQAHTAAWFSIRMSKRHTGIVWQQQTASTKSLLNKWSSERGYAYTCYPTRTSSKGAEDLMEDLGLLEQMHQDEGPGQAQWSTLEP